MCGLPSIGWTGGMAGHEGRDSNRPERSQRRTELAESGNIPSSESRPILWAMKNGLLILVFVALAGGLLFLRSRHTPPVVLQGEHCSQNGSNTETMTKARDTSKTIEGRSVDGIMPEEDSIGATVLPMTPSFKGQRTSELGGNSSFSEARGIIQMGARSIEYTASPDGLFPVVYMDKPEEVSVRVVFPEGMPGDVVHAQILDGGRFPDLEEIARALVLDADAAISFRYLPTGERGKFRIKLRNGRAVKLVEFWMGKPPVLGG